MKKLLGLAVLASLGLGLVSGASVQTVRAETSNNPTISHITPSSATAGTRINVYGSNFNRSTFVFLTERTHGSEGPYVSTKYHSPSRISFNLPSDLEWVGTYNVQVNETASNFSPSDPVPLVVELKEKYRLSLTLTASLATKVGNTYTTDISWVSKNSLWCEADWTSSQATSGTARVTFTENTSYSMTCYDPDFSVSDTLNVSVKTPLKTPTITSISPKSGGPNTTITLKGKNLSETSSVEFYRLDGTLDGNMIPETVSSKKVTFEIDWRYWANSEPGNYMIGVVTNNCQAGCDSNRLKFKLTEPVMKIKSPTTSTYWERGDYHKVKWVASNGDRGERVDIYLDGGPYKTKYLFADGTRNTGTYTNTLDAAPNAIPDGIYKLSVCWQLSEVCATGPKITIMSGPQEVRGTMSPMPETVGELQALITSLLQQIQSLTPVR